MNLSSLILWHDCIERPAPESMAVDEWLLETATQPVLRVYRWQGEWGSIGYFGKLEEAKATFPGLQWVRRWTGGGTVDHRADWPYSLIVPRSGEDGLMSGGDSYREIHAALEQALQAEGLPVRLSSGDESTGAAACFANPVSHDLVDQSGRKVAGAGQRRNRKGFLHQGSVAPPCDETISRQRAERLATSLSTQWQEAHMEIPAGWVERSVAKRYGDLNWNERRR